MSGRPEAAGATREPRSPPSLFDDVLVWLDAVRETAPVVWHAESASWYVTRYADVWDLLIDPRLGAHRVVRESLATTDEQRAVFWQLADFVNRWPVFSDPPGHTIARRLLRSAMSPEIARNVAATVRGTVLSRRCENPAEVLNSSVRPAFEAGLAQLLGHSIQDLAALARWSHDITVMLSMRGIDPVAYQRAAVALENLVEFVRTACDNRTGPLASAMRDAMEAGQVVLLDVVAAYAQVITGTLEPTAAAMAVLLEVLTQDRMLCHAFARQPGETIDEALRLATPLLYAPRRALCDMDLYGQRIPGGAKVVLGIAAANRDPRRFPDPLTFRPGRGNGVHLTFGRGRHACLGAGLARQMMVNAMDAFEATGWLHAARPLRVVWKTDLGIRVPRSMVEAGC